MTNWSAEIYSKVSSYLIYLSFIVPSSFQVVKIYIVKEISLLIMFMFLTHIFASSYRSRICDSVNSPPALQLLLLSVKSSSVTSGEILTLTIVISNKIFGQSNILQAKRSYQWTVKHFLKFAILLIALRSIIYKSEKTTHVHIPLFVAEKYFHKTKLEKYHK